MNFCIGTLIGGRICNEKVGCRLLKCCMLMTAVVAEMENYLYAGKLFYWYFFLYLCVFNLVNFPEVLWRLSTVSEKQTDG